MEALKKLLTIPILQNINECKNVTKDIEESKNKVQKIVNEIHTNPCLSNLYKLNDEYYRFYNLECNNYYSSKYLKMLYDTYQNALVYVLYKVIVKMYNSINNSLDQSIIFNHYNELITTSLYFTENYTKKNLEYIHNNIIYNLELIKPKIKQWINSTSSELTILIIKKIIINLLTGYDGLIIKNREKSDSILVNSVRQIIYQFISTIFNDYIFKILISFSEFSFLNVLFKKNEFIDVVTNVILHHIFVLNGKVIQEKSVKDIILEYDNKKINNIVDLYIETRRLLFKYVYEFDYSCEILKSLPYMSNMKLTNTLDKNVTYPYNYPRYSVDYEILQGINYIFNALQYEYYCTIISNNIEYYFRTFSNYNLIENPNVDLNKYTDLNNDVQLFNLIKYFTVYCEDDKYLELFNNSDISATSKQLTYEELKNKINDNWSTFQFDFIISNWSEECYNVLNANGQMYDNTLNKNLKDNSFNKILNDNNSNNKMSNECKKAEIYIYKNWSDEVLNNISDPCIDFLYYNDKDKVLSNKLDSYTNNSDKINFIKNGITIDNYFEYGLTQNTYNALQRYFSLFNKFICKDKFIKDFGHLTKIQFKYWLKYFSGTQILNDVTMNCFNYITFNDNKLNYSALVYDIYSDFQSNSIYYILYSINHQDNFTSNLNLNNCFGSLNPQFI